MEGPLRYRQLRNYANRRNKRGRQIWHLRDRFNPLEGYDDEGSRLQWLRFRLRKDSVSDLVKILDKDLQHETRTGVPLTPMQQVLIALRFYATGTFQKPSDDSREQFLEAIENYCPLFRDVSPSFPANSFKVSWSRLDCTSHVITSLSFLSRLKPSSSPALED